MVTRRPPDFSSRLIPTPYAQTPKSHGITSFADPHPLTPIGSYRFRKHGGQGGCFSCFPSSAQVPASSPQTWSYHHTDTLPRLISFVSHSYATLASRTVLRDENTRGVGGFFPFWNSPLSFAFPRRSDVQTCRRSNVLYSSPLFSNSCALFCPTAVRQLFWNQQVPHCFYRNGGCGGTL
jgi:hypothetical protein